MYSYLIQIICILLFCFKYLICTYSYGFKYSDVIQIICTLLFGFKYSYLIQKIAYLYGFKYSYLI